jgi:Uma2 family endonuclease
MTQTAPARPAVGPRPVRWTAAQFHMLGDLGMFEGTRASLLNGVVIEEGPMNPPHRIGLELTVEALRAAFGPGWRMCVQMPLVLGQSTDPEPDLAVVAGSPRAAVAHPTTAALVVEVADSSLQHDLTAKAEAYADARIADYWVLDVAGRRLHVLREPQPLPAGLGAAAYRTHLTLTAGDTATPLAAPTAAVAVADLLP